MKYFIVMLCLLTLTACNATTKLSGVVDPNYKGNFQARKVLTLGLGMSIDEQKTLENTLEKSFSKYDIQVLRGLEYFPPTRDYTGKDIYKIARSKGADTLLIVSADGRDISKTYIPTTYHPGKSTSYISGYGNYATVDTYTSPGYTTGGYSVSKPIMSVSVNLKNTKNKETIWTAEGISDGNGYASFSDLTISVAKTTVKKLAQTGLIAKKKIRQPTTKTAPK